MTEARALPLRVLFAVALAAGLALVMVGCGGSSSTPANASVPAVAGKPADEAVNTLSGAGFLSSVSRAPSTATPGNVISQSPAADASAPEGSTVLLVVSTGEYLAKVPPVTGQSVDAATATVQSAGFTVVLIGRANAAALGTVFETQPAANADAPVGSPVELVVSKGPASVAIPNVVGKKAADAVSALTAKGFTVAPVGVFSSTERGQVTAQTPAAGKSEAKGATIEISISQGTGTVTVPSLRGDSADVATAQLEQLGLEAVQTTVPSTPPKGSVVAQDPAPGTTLKTGSTVRFNVSNGTQTKTVSMPNLINLSRSVAQTQLTQLGLLFTVYVVPSSARVGYVIAQDPRAGTAVQVGSSVHFNTSGGQ
jgi:eukaryotic-like serine/threonine-protein kinase